MKYEFHVRKDDWPECKHGVYFIEADNVDEAWGIVNKMAAHRYEHISMVDCFNDGKVLKY